MKQIFALAAASVALGYSHGRTETVMISGGRGKDPIRVNKSDFDADQEGDKNMSLYQGQDEPDQAAQSGASDVNVTHEGDGGEVQTTAAPSAPNFSSGEGKTLPVDETKNAAAPAVTTEDQLLVMKSTKGKTKGKFVIANGVGQPITGDRAKALDIDEDGYDTEAAAKAVQTRTEPKPTAA